MERSSMLVDWKNMTILQKMIYRFKKNLKAFVEAGKNKIAKAILTKKSITILDFKLYYKP